MSIGRVFKGDDTGAAWFGDDCRLLLMLVNELDDAQLDEEWNFLGGVQRADSWTYTRGLGDFSMTVQTKGIERGSLEQILDSIGR